MKTEQEMLQERAVWKKKAGEYLKKLDMYLEQASTEGILSYLHVFEEPGVVEYCVPVHQELAYAYIIAIITIDEVKAGKGPSFLLLEHSVSDLIKIIKQLEFRMWEMEFSCAEGEARLLEYMENYGITPEVMKMVVRIAGMDKQACIYCIEKVYRRMNRNDYAEQMTS